MIITREVEVKIEFDPCDVLEKISTEDLVNELEQRDDFQGSVNWDRPYHLLATRQNDTLLAELSKLVEAQTGRIVP